MYSRFKDSIWVAYLAEMGLLSFFNCGVKYLLYVIDFFTKYSWVTTLAGKRAGTVPDGFVGILNESNGKPNKLWVD